MQTDPVTLGVCKGAACVAAGNGPVELYEGPGRYCPNCGALLQRHIPGKSAWSGPESRSPPPGEKPRSTARPPKPRGGRLAAFSSRSRPHARAALVVAGGAIMAFFVLWTMAIRHSALPGTVGVCTSSMTERVARDVLHEYGARNRALAEHFELRTTGCGVRFAIALDDGRDRRTGASDPPPAGHHVRTSAGAIGCDAVVAIVNPQNPVGQMSAEQLRKIVAGDLAKWTSLGGRSEPIIVYLPADSTDEARVVAAALMKGAAVGKSIVRVPSSADAVRAVVAANGANAIGLVAFSAAVPGKVVALQAFPVPSVLSIGDRRYPLSVAVIVASAGVGRDTSVSDLVTYAGSDDAKAIAERAGIITKGAYR